MSRHARTLEEAQLTCSTMIDESTLISEAARVIGGARALIVTAGAGMGVDAGLPDFRGDEGFWRAYPPFARLGLRFEEVSNPRSLAHDPALGWGFFGHRMELYRKTMPHDGYAILRRMAQRMADGYFVYTSNVDSHFERSGFDADRIVECHGTLAFMQCTARCGIGLFPSTPFHVDIDPETFRAAEPLPACPSCGALARPNALFFDDGEWDSVRSDAQRGRLFAWFDGLSKEARGRIALIECGAGSTIPTVRRFSERIAQSLGGTLVRINVREPEVPPGHIGLRMGALAGLRAIEARLNARA